MSTGCWELVFSVTKLTREVDRLGSTADRKSTRLNSSHLVISYAVFCLKKKITNNLANVRLYILNGTFRLLCMVYKFIHDLSLLKNSNLQYIFNHMNAYHTVYIFIFVI